MLRSFFLHRRTRILLSPFVDGELSKKLENQVEEHVLTCKRCREELDNIRFSRDFVRRAGLPEQIRQESVWQNIRNELLQQRTPFRHGFVDITSQVWRHKLRLVTVAGVAALLLIAVLRQERPASESVQRPHLSQASLAFDYGLYLESLTKKKLREDFDQRYQASTISFGDPERSLPSQLSDLGDLPKSYQVNSVKLLRSGCCQSVQFSCENDGRTVDIFQQAKGHPWTFGDFPMLRKQIDGVDCLWVENDSLRAVSWQGDKAEYIIIGNLDSEVVAEIMKAFK